MILPISAGQTIYKTSFKSRTNSMVMEPSSKTTRKNMPPIYVKMAVISPVATVMDKSRNSYNLFKAKVDSVFFDITRTDYRNPKKAFATIQYNKEKYSRSLDIIPTMKFKRGVDAKDFINDNNFISARIILDNATKEEGNRILSRLQKAIKDNKLVVTEIRQYSANASTEYASNSKLNAILEESNKAGYGCSKVTNRKANGYHSVVARIRLQDGFEGVLEIMGPEVARLKNVEDVIHTMEKGLPVSDKYAGLKSEFDKLTPKQYEELKEYTKEAYTAARADELFKTHSDGFVELTNPNLPKCFDFNNIAKI